MNTAPSPPPACGDTSKALAWFLATVALLSVLSVLPVLAYEHPALGDRLNHLARLTLMAGLAPADWQAHYAITGEWMPNLAQELIALPLVRLGLSPEAALNLFAAGLLLLQAWAVVALGWVSQRRLPWWALWAFPLSAGRYFLWGFLNYGFSLAIAFCALLTWVLAQRTERAWRRGLGGLATAGLLTLCVMSHMIGWGVGVVLIVLWQGGRRWSPHGPTWGRSALAVAAVVAPSLVLYAGWMSRGGARSPVYYDVLKGKVAGLASPFATYLPSVSALTMGAFVLIALWLAWRRAFVLRWRMPAPWLPVAGLLLLFLVMPASLMGSVFLDRRLFAPALLAALALWPVAWPSTRACIVVVSVITGVQAVRTAEFAWESWQQTQAVQQIRLALQQVPLGSRVVGANFTDSGRLEVPALMHAPSLAVADRGAWVPTLFAEPRDRMPIAFRQPAQLGALERTAPRLDNNHSPQARVNWAGYCGATDHLLVTWSGTSPRLPTGSEAPCLQPLANGPHWALYRSGGGAGASAAP